MVAEVSTVVERLAALLAPERPAACVGQTVIHQVAALREALSAHLADVRLLLGVHPAVHHEGA